MKNKNKINPNHHWCPWCKKEKLPGAKRWAKGPAMIPDTARDIICPKCFSKLCKENNVKEERIGNYRLRLIESGVKIGR